MTVPTGDSLKESALNVLRVTRAALIRKATAAALRVALSNGEVTADDVRGEIEMPADVSPKFVGVVFRDLADAGIICRAGYRNSTRPVAHSRPVSVWTLADRPAAAAYLGALEQLGSKRSN